MQDLPVQRLLALRLYYPDFFNDRMVLDAKYKGYTDWDNMQNADLYQLITYMHVLNVPAGSFIVPVEWAGPRLPLKKLTGIGGRVFIEGMHIPHGVTFFRLFVHQMHLTETLLKEHLKDINLTLPLCM